MGYIVTKIPYKKRTWKLQHETFENGKRLRKDVPESQWAAIGFLPSMTLEEARAKRTQLNAQSELKRHEERRQSIIQRLVHEKMVFDAYFNPHDVAEFEERLYARDKSKKKKDVYWRAVRRMLQELKIAPKDWEEDRAKFYDYFSENQYSPSYCEKLIAVLNLWGKFLSRKYVKPFFPLPNPVGLEKNRIEEAYFDKHDGGLESDPITYEMLTSVKSKMLPENWNWVMISLWFGLRPFEVDQLLTPQGTRSWSIEHDQGVDVLAVYQTKLVHVPVKERTKRIPVLYPEQKEALRLIQDQNFKRPLAKTMKKYFGERVTNYAGRKSFEDLMESRGQQFHHYSAWLGHQNIDRTWRDYKNKSKVRFTDPKKALRQGKSEENDE